MSLRLTPSVHYGGMFLINLLSVLGVKDLLTLLDKPREYSIVK